MAPYFENGEMVYCFHVDCLYSAKVMETNVVDDQLTYKVHYFGWSSRQDEWVRGDRVLKVNRANTKYMKVLMKEKKAKGKATTKSCKTKKKSTKTTAHSLSTSLSSPTPSTSRGTPTFLSPVHSTSAKTKKNHRDRSSASLSSPAPSTSRGTPTFLSPVRSTSAKTKKKHRDRSSASLSSPAPSTSRGTPTFLSPVRSTSAKTKKKHRDRSSTSLSSPAPSTSRDNRTPTFVSPDRASSTHTKKKSRGRPSTSHFSPAPSNGRVTPTFHSPLRSSSAETLKKLRDTSSTTSSPNPSTSCDTPKPTLLHPVPSTSAQTEKLRERPSASYFSPTPSTSRGTPTLLSPVRSASAQTEKLRERPSASYFSPTPSTSRGTPTLLSPVRSASAQTEKLRERPSTSYFSPTPSTSRGTHTLLSPVRSASAKTRKKLRIRSANSHSSPIPPTGRGTPTFLSPVLTPSDKIKTESAYSSRTPTNARGSHDGFSSTPYQSPRLLSLRKRQQANEEVVSDWIITEKAIKKEVEETMTTNEPSSERGYRTRNRPSVSESSSELTIARRAKIPKNRISRYVKVLVKKTRGRKRKTPIEKIPSTDTYADDTAGASERNARATRDVERVGDITDHGDEEKKKYDGDSGVEREGDGEVVSEDEFEEEHVSLTAYEDLGSSESDEGETLSRMAIRMKMERSGRVNTGHPDTVYSPNNETGTAVSSRVVKEEKADRKGRKKSTNRRAAKLEESTNRSSVKAGVKVNQSMKVKQEETGITSVPKNQNRITNHRTDSLPFFSRKFSEIRAGTSKASDKQAFSLTADDVCGRKDGRTDDDVRVPRGKLTTVDAGPTLSDVITPQLSDELTIPAVEPPHLTDNPLAALDISAPLFDLNDGLDSVDLMLYEEHEQIDDDQPLVDDKTVPKRRVLEPIEANLVENSINFFNRTQSSGYRRALGKLTDDYLQVGRNTDNIPFLEDEEVVEIQTSPVGEDGSDKREAQTGSDISREGGVNEMTEEMLEAFLIPKGTCYVADDTHDAIENELEKKEAQKGDKITEDNKVTRIKDDNSTRITTETVQTICLYNTDEMIDKDTHLVASTSQEEIKKVILHGNAGVNNTTEKSSHDCEIFSIKLEHGIMFDEDIDLVSIDIKTQPAEVSYRSDVTVIAPNDNVVVDNQSNQLKYEILDNEEVFIDDGLMMLEETVTTDGNEQQVSTDLIPMVTENAVDVYNDRQSASTLYDLFPILTDTVDMYDNDQQMTSVLTNLDSLEADSLVGTCNDIQISKDSVATSTDIVDICVTDLDQRVTSVHPAPMSTDTISTGDNNQHVESASTEVSMVTETVNINTDTVSNYGVIKGVVDKVILVDENGIGSKNVDEDKAELTGSSLESKTSEEGLASKKTVTLSRSVDVDLSEEKPSFTLSPKEEAEKILVRKEECSSADVAVKIESILANDGELVKSQKEMSSVIPSENLIGKGREMIGEEEDGIKEDAVQSLVDTNEKSSQETTLIDEQMSSLVDENEVNSKQASSLIGELFSDQEAASLVDNNGVSSQGSSSLVDEHCSSQEADSLIDELFSSQEACSLVDQQLGSQEACSLVDQQLGSQEACSLVDQQLGSQEACSLVDQQLGSQEACSLVDQQLGSQGACSLVDQELGSQGACSLVDQELGSQEACSLVDQQLGSQGACSLVDGDNVAAVEQVVTVDGSDLLYLVLVEAGLPDEPKTLNMTVEVRQLQMAVMTLMKPYLYIDNEMVVKRGQLSRVPAVISCQMIVNRYQIDILREIRRGQSTVKRSCLREFCLGVRDYFNRLLGQLLLYSIERDQYNEMSDNSRPMFEIYGFVHLARLLVKLPCLLAYSASNVENGSILFPYVTHFAAYLKRNIVLFYKGSADYLPKPATTTTTTTTVLGRPRKGRAKARN